MKLVPKFWKIPSVWAAVSSLATLTLLEMIQQSWISLPPHVQAAIPHSNQVSLILFILVLVVRVIQFTTSQEEGKDGDK